MDGQEEECRTRLAELEARQQREMKDQETRLDPRGLKDLYS